MYIALVQSGSPHRGRQTALNRIGRRSGRSVASSRKDIIVSNASTGATAEDATDHRIFGRGSSKRIRPGLANLCFGAAQKTRTDLDRAGTQSQNRGYTRPSAMPPVATTGALTASTTAGTNENKPT